MSDDFDTQCSGCGEYAGTHIHQKLVQQEDLIREQRALLEECERVIDAMRQEIQNLGGSLEGIITADELLSRLRAQEKADEAS